MGHPEYIRAKAVELRTERNLSIDEIAERLALSRTTVFYWLRDFPIDRSARPRTLAQLNGSIAMQAKYRRLREAAYEEGSAQFDELVLDASFRDFVCRGGLQAEPQHGVRVQLRSGGRRALQCVDLPPFHKNRGLLGPVPRRSGPR